MAANAILPEKWQNIAAEVHLTGILTEQNACERAYVKHGSSYSVILHTPSWFRLGLWANNEGTSALQTRLHE